MRIANCRLRGLAVFAFFSLVDQGAEAVEVVGGQVGGGVVEEGGDGVDGGAAEERADEVAHGGAADLFLGGDGAVEVALAVLAGGGELLLDHAVEEGADGGVGGGVVEVGEDVGDGGFAAAV